MLSCYSLDSFREMLEKQVFAVWCQKMSQHREHHLAERMVSGSPREVARTLRACFRALHLAPCP